MENVMDGRRRRVPHRRHVKEHVERTYDFRAFGLVSTTLVHTYGRCPESTGKTLFQTLVVVRFPTREQWPRMDLVGAVSAAAVVGTAA